MKATRFENSPADKREDKTNAKKHGMSMAKYEKSSTDRKADSAGQKKMDAKAKRK